MPPRVRIPPQERARSEVAGRTPSEQPADAGIGRRWKGALADRRFLLEALASALGLGVVLTLFTHYLVWVEQREGVVMYDPVLARIPSRDLGFVTFVLIYGGILVALAILVRHPRRFVSSMQAYAVLTGLRALLMSVTPLDSPEGLIPLHDPIVNSAVPGPDLQHDLFFSGHTSVLVLLACCVPTRGPRLLLLVTAVAVASLLLVQHAHYTVDVLAAPLAAWAAYSIAFLTRDPRLRT